MTALLTLLLACQTEPPAPEVPAIEAAEVATAAAQVFCRTAGEGCQAEGAVARLAGRQVEFSATVRHFKALPGKTIGMGTAKQDIPGEVQLEADLALSLDGRALIDGVVTHAASDPDLAQARAKTLDEAAQRFVVGHAVGLLDALSGQPEAPTLASLGLSVPAETLADGAWQAWAGYPVMRGQGLDPDLVKRMGPQVGSVLRGVAPLLDGQAADLHVVKVHAKLGGGAQSACGIVPNVMPVDGATVSVVPLTGTITLDGTPLPDGDKPAICALADTVAWPLPGAGRSLEWTQVVVVAPGVPAGE